MTPLHLVLSKYHLQRRQQTCEVGTDHLEVLPHPAGHHGPHGQRGRPQSSLKGLIEEKAIVNVHRTQYLVTDKQTRIMFTLCKPAFNQVLLKMFEEVPR